MCPVPHEIKWHIKSLAQRRQRAGSESVWAGNKEKRKYPFTSSCDTLSIHWCQLLIFLLKHAGSYFMTSHSGAHRMNEWKVNTSRRRNSVGKTHDGQRYNLFLLHIYAATSLSKPGAYITHNATQPLTDQAEIQVCCVIWGAAAEVRWAG